MKAAIITTIIVLYVIPAILGLFHFIYTKRVSGFTLILALTPIINIFGIIARVQGLTNLTSWMIDPEIPHNNKENKLNTMSRRHKDIADIVESAKDPKKLPKLTYKLGGRKSDDETYDHWHPVGIENWIAVAISKLLVLNK